MDSLTLADEAPIGSLRVCAAFETRVPSYRDRNSSTISEIDDQ